MKMTKKYKELNDAFNVDSEIVSAKTETSEIELASVNAIDEDIRKD